MQQEHAMNDRYHTPPRTTLHRLREHRFLRLPRPAGLCLRSERGTLWVTVDGELDDIELAPGHSRVFAGKAPVLVGAVAGDAVFSTTFVPAPSWMDRLQRWVSGPTRWLHA
jgi:hypothetical protein